MCNLPGSLKKFRSRGCRGGESQAAVLIPLALGAGGKCPHQKNNLYNPTFYLYL